jgi:hypothetical protein
MEDGRLRPSARLHRLDGFERRCVVSKYDDMQKLDLVLTDRIRTQPARRRGIFTSETFLLRAFIASTGFGAFSRGGS